MKARDVIVIGALVALVWWVMRRQGGATTIVQRGWTSPPVNLSELLFGKKPGGELPPPQLSAENDGSTIPSFDPFRIDPKVGACIASGGKPGTGKGQFKCVR